MSRLHKSAAFLLVMVAGWMEGVAAQDAVPPGPETAPALLDAGLTASDVEQFFEAAWLIQRQEHELAGMTAAVVQNGEVLYLEGYGWADVEERVPVDPERTLFRIASISKPFTWTAVMQLVEQGKLDLDADITEYLGVPLDTPHGAITLRHLMTHTPGLEDEGTGLMSRTTEDLAPLSEFLAAHQPAQVRPPGSLSAYSNHGSALAGLIVEEVSGQPWETYVEENILDPLAMRHTNLRQPVHEDLAGDHAKGYRWSNGRYEANEFFFQREPPAGVISSTAADMSRFMLAHLQMGRLGEARILKEETAARMQSELFRHHPAVNPFLHGFYRSDRNGVIILGHGGNLPQFHSDMLLFPEHGVGLFVSFNSDPSSALRNLVAAFIDRFFPQEVPPAPEAPQELVERLGDYVGEYGPLRRSFTTFARLAILVGSLHVSQTEEDQLRTSSGGRVRRWVPVEPDVFRELYSETRLAFRRGEGGEVTHLFFSNGTAYEPLAWHESTALHNRVLIFVGVISLLGLLGYSYRAFRRARPERRLPVLFVGVAWLACALAVFNLLRLFQGLTGPTEEFNFGVPEPIRLLFALALVHAVIALTVAGAAVWTWIKGLGRPWVRIRYSAVAAAGLLLAAFMAYWNVLGYYL